MLIVAGMHRSGTSALSGTLAQLGFTLPATLLPATPDNPKGYFESARIVRMDDDLLASVHSSWHDWRSIDLAPLGGEGPDTALVNSRLMVADEYGEADHVLVKDPRICRLLPHWLDVAETLGFEPVVVIPYRPAAEVAESLARRDNMSIEHARLLWLRHALDAERHSRGFRRAFVDMRNLLANPQATLALVANRLGKDWPVPLAQALPGITEFLDSDLRTARVSRQTRPEHSALAPRLASQVETAFRHLEDDPTDPAAMAQLDEVGSQLDEVEALLGPAPGANPYAWTVKERLERELADNHREVRRVSDLLTQTAETLERTAADLDHRKTEIGLLQSYLDAEREESKSQTLEAGRFETLLQSATADLDHWREAHRIISSHASDLGELVQSLHTRIDGQTDAFADTIAKLNEQLAAERDAQRAQLAQIARAHDASLASHVAEVEVLTNQHADLRAHAQALDAALAGRAADIETLTGQLADLRGHVQEQDTALAGRAAEIEALVKQLADFRAREHTLMAKAEEAADRERKLDLQLAAALADAGRLTEQADQLQIANARLTRELADGQAALARSLQASELAEGEAARRIAELSDRLKEAEHRGRAEAHRLAAEARVARRQHGALLASLTERHDQAFAAARAEHNAALAAAKLEHSTERRELLSKIEAAEQRAAAAGEQSAIVTAHLDQRHSERIASLEAQSAATLGAQLDQLAAERAELQEREAALRAARDSAKQAFAELEGHFYQSRLREMLGDQALQAYRQAGFVKRLQWLMWPPGRS